MMFNAASYQVLFHDDDIIVLRDIGDHSRVLTITNDAERVCVRVLEGYPDRRIFYYDSDGELTEMQYDPIHDRVTFRGYIDADTLKRITEFNAL